MDLTLLESTPRELFNSMQLELVDRVTPEFKAYVTDPTQAKIKEFEDLKFLLNSLNNYLVFVDRIKTLPYNMVADLLDLAKRLEILKGTAGYDYLNTKSAKLAYSPFLPNHFKKNQGLLVNKITLPELIQIRVNQCSTFPFSLYQQLVDLGYRSIVLNDNKMFLTDKTQPDFKTVGIGGLCWAVNHRESSHYSKDKPLTFSLASSLYDIILNH